MVVDRNRTVNKTNKESSRNGSVTKYLENHTTHSSAIMKSIKTAEKKDGS